MTISFFLSLVFTVTAILSFLPYVLGFDNKDNLKPAFSAIWIICIILCHSVFATDMACRYGTNIPTEELIFTRSALNYIGGFFFGLHILMGIFPTTQTRRYLTGVPLAVAKAPVLVLWELPKTLFEVFVAPPVKRIQKYMTK